MKLFKVDWEQLQAQLATSHGKRLFLNNKCTVHCSNIAINNANCFMTPNESIDLAAVKRERTLLPG